MRICGAAASLAVLCALAAAVQAKSAGERTASSALKDAADDYCASCMDTGVNASQYLPIRGPDEVQYCNDGYYCDCHLGKKERCATVPLVNLHGKFDPDKPNSACNPTHNCQKWFDDHPDPIPVTTTTSGNPTTTPDNPTTTPAEPTTTPGEPTTTPGEPTTTTPGEPTTTPDEPTTTPASSSLSPYSTRPTPASSSLAPSSTTSSPSTPVPSTTCLPTQCPFRLSLMLPDPTDCHRYIRCYYGESWNMPCAIGTWFSFSRQACVYLEQSDCAIKN